jgi:hypothetical protein
MVESYDFYDRKGEEGWESGGYSFRLQFSSYKQAGGS